MCKNVNFTNYTHNAMKTKQATVVLKGQEWIVIDTADTKDGKIFCTLMSPDGSTALHAWVDINQIVGII